MKKNELPGWFPFAITASFLIAIGAGIRSNWTLAADQPKPPSPPPEPSTTPPPVKKAGVLQEWPGVSYG